jgi:O-antigen/teichoic acid export membrane protein
LQNTKNKNSFQWAISGTYIKYFAQFFVTLILVRIISPKDFGLMAMTATVITFLNTFTDFGLSWVVIKEQNLNQRQHIAIFWMNTLVGVVLGGLCFALAPAIGLFYEAETVTLLVRLQAINFLLIGMYSMPAALLRRDMRFAELTKYNLFAAFVGHVVVLSMALSGFGVWALAAGPLVNSFVLLSVLLIFSGVQIRKPHFEKSDLRFLKFGGLLTLSGVFFYVSRNLDDILIGKFYGPSQLAFFTKAYFLMMLSTFLPSGAIGQVFVSVIAREKEKGEEAWKRDFSLYLRNFLFFSAPVCVGLSLTASETVSVIYGARWEGSVPILFWLALAGLFQPWHNSVDWVLIGLGRAKVHLYWSAMTATVLSFCFWFGAQISVEAVAMFYLLGISVFVAIPSQLFIHIVYKIPIMQTFNKTGPVLLCTGILAASVLGVKAIPIVQNQPSYWRLTILSLTGIIAYVASALVLVKPIPLGFRLNKPKKSTR